MRKVITVSTAGDWWSVHTEALAAPLMFKSGAKAEETAKRLAEALASTGKWAEINVIARDGKPAERFVCPPQVPPDVSGAHLSDDMTKQDRAVSPRAPSLRHRQMGKGHNSRAQPDLTY